MGFLEKTLGRQELLALLSPEIAHETHIVEVFRLAASSQQWGDQHKPPEAVIQRILYVFKALDWIDVDSLEVASEFMSGECDECKLPGVLKAPEKAAVL